MQGTTSSNATSSKVGNPTPMAMSKASKDDSGLHDLKALASSAKNRRRKRRTTQMEATQSLLASTAGLEAVVLPDPRKSVAMPAVTLADVGEAEAPAKAVASVAALQESKASTSLAVSTAAAELPEAAKTSSSSTFYIVAALGLVGVAAAAFFILGGKDKKNTDASEAQQEIAVAEVIPAENTEPVIEPGTTDPDMGAGAEEAAVAVDPIAEAGDNAPEASPAVEEVDPAIALAKKEEEKAAEEAKKAERVAARKAAEALMTPEELATAKAARAEKIAKAKEEKLAKKEAAKAAKEAKLAAKALAAGKKDEKKPKPASGDSLDDVLSSVTGGLDKVEKPKEAAGPTKKTLGRSDVKKAMGKVAGRAKKCYSVEEYSGMVNVKYSVSPDGSLHNVTPTGAHKSSKTGKCVAKAVSKAKFPAFSGSPMSFSFPFMLTP